MQRRFQGYGLDALLGQLGELSKHVHTQMGAPILTTKAIAETIEERANFCFQSPKLVGVHALPSRSPFEDWIFAPRIGQHKIELVL